MQAAADWQAIAGQISGSARACGYLFQNQAIRDPDRRSSPELSGLAHWEAGCIQRQGTDRDAAQLLDLGCKMIKSPRKASLCRRSVHHSATEVDIILQSWGVLVVDSQKRQLSRSC